MAYYAASQILVFLAQEFGFPKVVSMLPRWGAGERTARGGQGVARHRRRRSSTAASAPGSRPRLARYTKQYVPDLHTPPLDDARKAARASPNDAKKEVELALALYADGQKPEGDAVLAEALRLDPKQPDAEYVTLRVALREKNVPEAERIVAKMIADGNDGYAIRMKAALLAENRKDAAAEKQNLEAANRLDPTQVEPLQGLYDLAHKSERQGRRALGAPAHRHARPARPQGVEPAPRAPARAGRVGGGAEDRARARCSSTCSNWRTHRLYARALARTGRFVSAVYELNSALVCKPKPKDEAEIYGELAKAYDKLSEPEMAKQARELERQVASAPAAAPPASRRHNADDDDQGT